jgi:Bacterial PH domain
VRSRVSSAGQFVSQAFRGLRSAAQSVTRVKRVIPAGLDRYLVPTERNAMAMRQHPAVLMGPGVLVLAGLVAAIIFGGMIPRDKQGFLLVVWIAWLILLLRFSARIMGWATAFFVISSTRMLTVTGQVSRKINSIPFASLTNMSVRRSLGGRLLGYGSLIVEYGGLDQKVQKIEYLPYAEELYVMVSETIFRNLDKEESEERVPCPVCNGEGRIFRRAPKSFTAGEPVGEDLPVDDGPRAREDLITQGYVETVCPECDGEGTVPSKSS